MVTGMPEISPRHDGICKCCALDDHTRKFWIYFLKVKSETFDKFKEFKALIENQTGRHIHILRSNNEGEYESNEFDYFCQEARIKRELIVPYNPQQNGVAERKNKTICEAAKAMITDLDLPLSLWAEAACTAVYIQNRSLLPPFTHLGGTW